MGLHGWGDKQVIANAVLPIEETFVLTIEAVIIYVRDYLQGVSSKPMNDIEGGRAVVGSALPASVQQGDL